MTYVRPPGGSVPSPEPAAATTPPAPRAERYPMLFDVAYPAALSRWKTALRLILALPVALVAYPLASLLSASLTLGWIAVIARRTYPGWLFHGVSGALAFIARVEAYVLLLTDRYPSFNATDSPVTLVYAEPPGGRLSRWRVVLWKLALIAPHLFVLSLLALAVATVTILAWFAILFTGNYPRGLFGFVVGVQRWRYRLSGYFASFNDRLPPYALAAEAGPASSATAALSAVLGLLLVGSSGGLLAAAAALVNDRETVAVSYAELQQGEDNQGWTVFDDLADDEVFFVRLVSVADPDDATTAALGVEPGYRVVTFHAVYGNLTGARRSLAPDSARLRYSTPEGPGSALPLVLLADGAPAPAGLDEGVQATVRLTFLVPAGAHPTELLLDPPWTSVSGIRFRFE